VLRQRRLQLPASCLLLSAETYGCQRDGATLGRWHMGGYGGCSPVAQHYLLKLLGLVRKALRFHQLVAHHVEQDLHHATQTPKHYTLAHRSPGKGPTWVTEGFDWVVSWTNSRMYCLSSCST
jgi:hypothetical protein